MRKVKNQPIKVATNVPTYWGHTANKGQMNAEGEFIENPRANPDSLDESMGIYQVNEATREVQDRVRKLMALAKQILTQQQYNVFVLMAVKDPALTEREAAKALSITRGRVHQLWVIAREKLAKAYDERT